MAAMDSPSDGSRVTLRRAALSDADTASEIYLCARHAAVLTIPPLAHEHDEVRRWFREVVVTDRETWLAEQDDRPMAVMVLDGDELDQLYVHPDWTNRGVGSALLRLAQHQRPSGLTLWTFQSNRAAQRFYERHGFVAVSHTDGSGNEERAPDIRYAWQPGGTPPASTQ